MLFEMHTIRRHMLVQLQISTADMVFAAGALYVKDGTAY